MIRNLHVTHGKDGRWEVKFSGQPNPIKVAHSQNQAIKYAKQMAKSEKCELIIHGENGEVLNKLSF